MTALSDALNAVNVNGWSSREIARRSGDRINHATVSKYLNGTHALRPTEEALEALAAVFPALTLQQLRELAGAPAGEQTPYQPPAEANRLDARQRRAVDEIIRLLADTAGGEHGGNTAATIGPERTIEDVLAAQRTHREQTKREQMQKIQTKAARKPRKTD